MNDAHRDQSIKELMTSIHRNTEGSKCIDVYEILLKEISDKNVVDTAIVEMFHFAGEFSRLCRDVDNMKNLDYKSKILTDEFINPGKYFTNSYKLAKLYLLLGDILEDKYKYIVCDIEKKILLPGKNRLGDLYHKTNYTSQDVINISKFFGDLSNLTEEDVEEKYELARKVVLLYNYMPAIVKAFLQTKRRELNLDQNSKKFGK